MNFGGESFYLEDHRIATLFRMTLYRFPFEMKGVHCGGINQNSRELLIQNSY